MARLAPAVVTFNIAFDPIATLFDPVENVAAPRSARLPNATLPPAIVAFAIAPDPIATFVPAVVALDKELAPMATLLTPVNHGVAVFPRRANAPIATFEAVAAPVTFMSAWWPIPTLLFVTTPAA